MVPTTGSLMIRQSFIELWQVLQNGRTLSMWLHHEMTARVILWKQRLEASVLRHLQRCRQPSQIKYHELSLPFTYILLAANGYGGLILRAKGWEQCGGEEWGSDVSWKKCEQRRRWRSGWRAAVRAKELRTPSFVCRFRREARYTRLWPKC